MLTQEDIKNILILTGKAQISGADAIAVAVLQQKLRGMLKEEKKEDKKVDKKVDKTVGKDK